MGTFDPSDGVKQGDTISPLLQTDAVTAFLAKAEPLIPVFEEAVVLVEAVAMTIAMFVAELSALIPEKPREVKREA